MLCEETGLKQIGISLLALLALVLLALPHSLRAQENPYFVAYDHNLEEPGNLEVEYFSTFGTQRAGNNFHSYWTELEYGVKAWWTTEFYLDAQSTFHDSTVYSGCKWENRFRVLQHEHWINPVLYAEFEDINGADKTLKEVVGHDTESDYATSNGETRREHKREIELKLISFQQHQGLEFFGKHHCREKPVQRAVGIRLRPGGEPAARPESLRQALQCLSPEFYRWSGTIRRIGRPPQLRIAGYFTLSCTGCRLESAERMDAASFSRVRSERQQSQISAALGSLAGDQRIRSVGCAACSEQNHETRAGGAADLCNVSCDLPVIRK